MSLDNGVKKMDIKPTALRLRDDTLTMLRAELRKSAHRSMATLADELLHNELRRRGHNTETDLNRLISAAGEIS